MKSTHSIALAGPGTHVGYVGVGIMGAAMARNLLRGGVRVTACNRTRSKAEALVPDGATVVDTPAQLIAAGCEVVFLNLPDTPDVERVLCGEAGVLSAPAEQLAGLVVVDHSTICPVGTRALAAQLAERGVTLCDAPVSGGDVGAREGTLSIMCGGDAAALERVRPLLEMVGKKIAHLGPAGSGQACKACNQAAVVATLVGVCEALALAKRSGLDLQQVVGVLAGGAAQSWQLEQLGPKVARGDHAPGFMIDLLLKDLRLVSGAAADLKLPMPITGLIEALFRAAASQGHGSQGTQAVASVLETLGGFRYDRD
ncbi:NAD(P)-dependent oxidoreductase [Botrimarina hoheduenensis]|uniref:2-hydroxy-3-oxopropionate reductase n=1 Tax=Botrimarina hoheduenensis TaxID=2528000 RepID=A0A5C5WF81_9BACT|nr:NAD(P)-dependent oxidoreductase [Botrimarina hoheduenensis]TWT48761.1 2-hydroxy-3-oxopropionate reductase [Botrimarina hoheduenensis]